MTRYLLDTNIFIYLATDVDSINNDVPFYRRQGLKLLYNEK